jgi:hypothetical protein
MHGFIALYLIACLDPTNHNTCVSLPVTDSTQAQPDGSEMSMMGCMGIEGANSAKKFWEDHPDSGLPTVLHESSSSSDEARIMSGNRGSTRAIIQRFRRPK